MSLNTLIKRAVFTTVSVTNAGALVLAANPRRFYASIQNVSSADIYIMFESQGVVGQGILIPKNGFTYEIDKLNLWQGEVYAIHASGAAKDVNVLDCN